MHCCMSLVRVSTDPNWQTQKVLGRSRPFEATWSRLLGWPNFWIFTAIVLFLTTSSVSNSNSQLLQCEFAQTAHFVCVFARFVHALDLITRWSPRPSLLMCSGYDFHLLLWESRLAADTLGLCFWHSCLCSWHPDSNDFFNSSSLCFYVFLLIWTKVQRSPWSRGHLQWQVAKDCVRRFEVRSGRATLPYPKGNRIRRKTDS